MASWVLDMNDFDVQQLLTPRSEASPSGDDLEYDPDFIEMESAAQGKPEQQYGETIIPGEPPDWKSVEQYAKGVLNRSHDLRAAVQLANAALNQYGLQSFAEVIDLVRGMVVDYWETFHPQLDPDDDNDPTIRVNTLMALCDSATTLDFLLRAPLVDARAVGRFGLLEWKVAHGELPWPSTADGPAPKTQLIEAAFQECELAALEANSQAARTALEGVKKIEGWVTDQVGAAQSCNFEKLVKELTAIQKLLDEQLSRRAPETADQPQPTADDTAAEGNSGSAAAPAGAVAQPAAQRAGFANIHELVIHTRQEAIVALDKICQYFERHEPSSPLPLLLKRARRLSNKSFLEIIRDISPDGIHQVESLGGLDDNSEISNSSADDHDYPSGGSPAPSSSGDTY